MFFELFKKILALTEQQGRFEYKEKLLERLIKPWLVIENPKKTKNYRYRNAILTNALNLRENGMLFQQKKELDACEHLKRWVWAERYLSR